MIRFERPPLAQTMSRRDALTAFAAATGAFVAGDAIAQTTARAVATGAPSPPLLPAGADQTVALQTLIDANAPRGRPVVLPPGPLLTGPLTLRPGTILTGNGATRLVAAFANPNGGPLLSAKDAPGLRLSGFSIDGNWRLPGAATALVAFTDCANLMLDGLTVMQSSGHGIALTRCTGRIERCQLSDILDAAIFSLDGRMAMTGNTIEACGNNGILVWRSAPGEDGSELSGNRISKIRADGGGTGQNGNGINVFRSGAVRVHGNTITDCAYSAVRGNAASNLLVQANTCLRLGEVAIYCEYALPKAGSEPRPGF
ncbi:MAG: TIGR03808 family TAT-translocated repetitive protein, partial [Hyphomicrobiaceae bacterium]|nr:TIGR03808 family TAT-translocated repetitive protein [Hyphomicrobiaceae bacterium]